MEEQTISKKIKTTKWIFNSISAVMMIVFNLIIYRLLSYEDFLFLDYLPLKLLIIAEVLLVLAVILPFVLMKGKKRTIASIVISIVLILSLVCGSIFCIVYDKQLKNIVLKADETIDKVVENAHLSVDEYGVYVLKEDNAQSLSDINEYNIGYCVGQMGDDSITVLQSIYGEMTDEPNMTEYNDFIVMAKNFITNKRTKAIILNQSMIDLIESTGKDASKANKKNDKQSTYLDDTLLEDFSSKIKCIYTINIENEMKKINDPGNITGRCFNVYISGIDTEGTINAKSRSDVNIIMSVNPMTHNIVLVSTPRDFYVPLSISNGVKDKLTHAGNYGVEVSIDTLEMLYGIEIDYFIRMNFTGFEDIINALGGIDVESDYSFYTHGYSYNAGWNYDLSGIEALWFARERKSFGSGDRQRGSNQMKVIEAVIEKCQSAALLRNYDEILNNVSESFQTNISKESIQALVKYQLAKSPDWDIYTYSVTGSGSSQYTYTIPSARAYVMEPDETTIQNAMKLFEDNKYNRKIEEVTTTE